MNNYSFLILLLFSAEIFAFDSVTVADKEFIRFKFYEAVENEEALDELEQYILKKYSDKIGNYDSFILTYYGGVVALKAKHAFNPFSKLNYLIDALDILENSVKKFPNDLEVRFMRFSILHFVPAIVGYSPERNDDLNNIYLLLMKKDFSNLDRDIQSGIVQFMLDSGRLSKLQFAELRKLINE